MTFTSTVSDLTSLHGKYQNKFSMLYVNMHVCMYVLYREGYLTSILSTELQLQEHGLENL